VRIAKNNPNLITVTYNRSINIIELSPDTSKNLTDSKPGFIYKNVTTETLYLEDLITNSTYLDSISHLKTAIAQKNGDF
jgi:hypothetical protein